MENQAQVFNFLSLTDRDTLEIAAFSDYNETDEYLSSYDSFYDLFQSYVQRHH